MHLIDVRYIDQGIDAQVRDFGTGFFAGFALRGLLNGFSVFHKSGRQRPEPFARFDRTPAQQDLSAPRRNAPGNDVRVLVMNGLAVIAHVAQARIALRDVLADGMAALAAKFHAELSGVAPILAVLADLGQVPHGVLRQCGAWVLWVIWCMMPDK
ncbi:hypothetical protein PLUA15_160036 [Pseudomonas lundensis]|uniref:Uncharacterized protein n=1 Tax=Pseudomonas lundensis TaxID=86185 RepID=A0AAX2H2Y8_9PSED|nr:hypothetical protein PLUA15_160036 [Pseudomonas lundensis]